ncbi:hypothetical protein ACILG0_00645 [Pseudomonadota bacterium AL_CKDN230030165-1A_HGKHYDSX7]
MSEHHQFLFPLHPHLPAPDWRALDARLREQGYVLAPEGDGVPARELDNLSLRLSRALDCAYQYDADTRTPADILALYIRTGALPADFPLHPHAGIADTLALLTARGIVFDDTFADTEGSDWRSPYYRMGPATRALMSPDTAQAYDAEPRAFGLLLLAYDGPDPAVHVGENLNVPTLPGSTDPLEDMPPYGSYLDFIGAAYADPTVQWHAPDGRAYTILELDWQYSFSLGYRMVRTDGLDEDSARNLAKAIGEMVGVPMGCSHRHL